MWILIFMLFCGNAWAQSTAIVTQYGYIEDQNGHIVGKYDNDIKTGKEITLPDGYSYVAVGNELAINSISIYKDPLQNFSTDIFVQQLAQTSLISNISLLPYYAALKDLTLYKNFQALANLVSGLLGAGIMKQSDVEAVDSILENQQINLDSYNSEVNVAY